MYKTREEYNACARKHYWKNRPKMLEKLTKANIQRSNNPVWRQRHALKTKLHNHGLTETEYDDMLIAQDHKCAACGCNLTVLPNKQIHIDHDHTTNETRAILCIGCNLALGHMKENPLTLRMLANYIEKWNG